MQDSTVHVQNITTYVLSYAGNQSQQDGQQKVKQRGTQNQSEKKKHGTEISCFSDICVQYPTYTSLAVHTIVFCFFFQETPQNLLVDLMEEWYTMSAHPPGNLEGSKGYL